ncbi:hypothetical protein GDO81_006173 [Engystomops pustulosus]|uniref:Uncharacterized protein n=1 Tax=Engystomops pustulosus TaxID=76066 RepID=A0AAV7CUZ7_ENGPU|nr:hypothetical protein GDO81_006173 [Engystomops pustulosus]
MPDLLEYNGGFSLYLTPLVLCDQKFVFGRTYATTSETRSPIPRATSSSRHRQPAVSSTDPARNIIKSKGLSDKVACNSDSNPDQKKTN